ncbi:MAG: methylthioribulose 1-phosphate dehydratase [Gluconacetobacter diazotrophicus]|nr:methylthioribulose 1-phosphate dehydratase [Gluconacetobacter diazotrophicus]
MDTAWSEAAARIVAAGQWLDRRFWVPATAGNLSERLADGRIAITRSGNHKGRLTPADIIEVDADGAPLRPELGRPSAETGLHCQIYRHFPSAGAVLHGHSVPATVLSLHRGALDPVDALHFENMELLKAFEAQTTHATRLSLPVVDNDQDMSALARRLEPILPRCSMGYLLRGHGIYVWAPDMDLAIARMEALEFLLGCLLESRKLEAALP